MLLGFGEAKIQSRPMPDVISHRKKLEQDSIASGQWRGAAIIKVRGLCDAARGATGEPQAPEPSRDGTTTHPQCVRSPPRARFIAGE